MALALALARLINLLAFCLVVCSSINGAAEAGAAAARNKVVIEGSVKCIYCVPDERGPGSVQKIALLPGAVVKVQCNNTNKGWEEKTTTDSKGRYVLKPEKVSSRGAHKCKVFLVSSPRPDCPVILYSDSFGFALKPNNSNTTPLASPPIQRFTIQDLVFYPGPFMCA